MIQRQVESAGRAPRPRHRKHITLKHSATYFARNIFMKQEYKNIEVSISSLNKQFFDGKRRLVQSEMMVLEEMIVAH